MVENVGIAGVGGGGGVDVGPGLVRAKVIL